jgi:hypothetical protein
LVVEQDSNGNFAATNILYAKLKNFRIFTEYSPVPSSLNKTLAFIDKAVSDMAFIASLMGDIQTPLTNSLELNKVIHSN